MLSVVIQGFLESCFRFSEFRKKRGFPRLYSSPESAFICEPCQCLLQCNACHGGNALFCKGVFMGIGTMPASVSVVIYLEWPAC